MSTNSHFRRLVVRAREIVRRYWLASAVSLTVLPMTLLGVSSFTSAGEQKTNQISGMQFAQNTTEMSPISGPASKPRRHSRLRDPASLEPVEANRIYSIVSGALDKGYGLSKVEQTTNYQAWPRYNRAPYLSSTHGNHYLNNYANATAANYGDYETAGKFPIGSVIAKDSFTVTRTGGILLGPLYVMEKMSPGFNSLTGDWKYMQIQPNGELLGETNGQSAERVEYCIACHLARADHDHLYFIPQDYRNAQVK